MGRPRRSDAPPTADRILQAAEAEISRVGMASARLEDIAAAAGIKKPSLLYHFPSKEILYAAVVERVFGALGARFTAAAAAPAAGQDRVDALIDAFERFADERPALSAIVLHSLLSGAGQEALGDAMEPLLDTVAAWIRAERPEAPAVDLRAALLTLASSALVRAAAGTLRGRLWGEAAPLVPMARALLRP